MLNHLCPCCRRHCYMDDLKCPRGEECAQTGVIPPHKPKGGSHGGSKSDPNSPRMLYMKMDSDEKLIFNIKDMAHTISALEENGQEISFRELFDCLREADRADLLVLLEKVKHTWHHRFVKRDSNLG